ncbi:hypothetical protein C0Q70_11580 [Pomacea canaliculata]|uniref:Uncharacterized protein n=1 Tax=Pomacea canaliculata TaxID=400727 RepID=A0A2T7P6G5_POMCA|nr:hypothetical protein C0Q70_11580 [Pomacea canaliculata]
MMTRGRKTLRDCHLVSSLDPWHQHCLTMETDFLLAGVPKSRSRTSLVARRAVPWRAFSPVLRVSRVPNQPLSLVLYLPWAQQWGHAKGNAPLRLPPALGDRINEGEKNVEV